MTTVQPPRSPCLVLALALACALAATAAGHGQGVHWAHIGNECRGTVGLVGSASVFGCGAHGVFLIGDPTSEFVIGPGCRLGGGDEEPARYNREASDLLTSAGGWAPCNWGSCFGHLRAGEPWVAVLDWNDSHGWSVGEVVLEASDRQVGVSLFDLFGARERLPALGPRVTDVDVLTQLCAVAELAYFEPDSRPVALNMSFGRVPSDAPGCTGPAGGPIACQVRAVLDHLYGDLGIVPVAAAGNHAELLFPAAHPAVLSAGALELASFVAQDGQVEPSRETPPEAEALVLGYGLYLENPEEIGDLWPVPAGSSYAAAMMTGWIAAASGDGTGFRGRGLDTSGQWRPVAVSQSYGLAFNGSLVRGSVLKGPARMIAHARGDTLEPSCWTAPPEARRAVAIGAEVLSLPDLSVVDLDTDSGPMPGSRPCIPCQADEPPPPPPTDLFAPSGDLLLNLQASVPLPKELVLHEAYLRAGPKVYQLVPFDGTVEQFLEDLGTGQLEQVLVTGLDGVAGPGDQLSLVFTMSVGGSPDVWDAVPIAVHSVDKEPSCDGVIVKGTS